MTLLEAGRHTPPPAPAPAAPAAPAPAAPAAPPPAASAPVAPTLEALVEPAARHFGVDARALLVRTRQHLPRTDADLRRIDPREVRREIDFCAERLRRATHRVADHLPSGPISLTGARFAEIEEATARPILTNLHHLGSIRPGSRHFALLDPAQDRPIVLCGLSTLRWPRLERTLAARFPLPPDGVILGLTRTYAVPGAPVDAVPALLTRVRDRLRREASEIALLTTVVDPTLGFTGTSYRAAQWQQWLTVPARPYLYYNFRHVTPDQLLERFGTSSFAALRARSAAFQQSRGRLLDLLLFCCRVRGSTEPVRPQDRIRVRR